MKMWKLFVVVFLALKVIVFGCFSSNPIALHSHVAHRALDATTFRDSQEFTKIRTRCAKELLTPYSKKEIRALVTTVDLPSQIYSKQYASGNLSCEFNKDDNDCFWHNNPSFKASFQKGYFLPKFDPERFACTNPNAFSFDDAFLVVTGDLSSQYYDAAIETNMLCLREPALLNLNFWTNGNEALLRVCLITPEDDLLECFGLDFSKNPIELLVNKIREPFILRIEVNFLQNGEAAIIDNISFKGDFCEQDQKDAEAQFDVVNRIRIPDFLPMDVKSSEGEDYREACRSLVCDFNRNSKCEYGNLENITKNMWKLGYDKAGLRKNANNSIEDGFAYVGSKQSSLCRTACVLESTEFRLRHSAHLLFDLFLTVGSTLQVCINSLKLCPYTSPRITLTKSWFYDQNVTLPPFTRKVLFVAFQLQPHPFIAIDNIRLRNAKNMEICSDNSTSK